MNERINELRKQVSVDMHLHNLEDFRAMSGCFGLEGGNKIVDDYLEKFAELIVLEMCNVLDKAQWDKGEDWVCADGTRIIPQIKQHFGVEE
jgi:hypothetical protein